MNAYVTYELVANQTDLVENFKSKMMSDYSYFDKWFSGPNNNQFTLPNGGLWKPNISLEQAYQDCVRCGRQLNIEFKSLIIVPATPWVGASSVR
ncbi:hypothetical protein CLV59_105130 [Chitinophaga dinghuensis]|uniref:Uncharacterized protein n=1 Tax=Chitinophaga dinghuensis TaxID=1539050 RepID=A0A327VXG7_9BACT|nr:hypothetical protein CLV59_105130 [Chitinophaga dinghuensis]